VKVRAIRVVASFGYHTLDPGDGKAHPGLRAGEVAGGRHEREAGAVGVDDLFEAFAALAVGQTAKVLVAVS
jgi:hypothetical protein